MSLCTEWRDRSQTGTSDFPGLYVHRFDRQALPESVSCFDLQINNFFLVGERLASIRKALDYMHRYFRRVLFSIFFLLLGFVGGMAYGFWTGLGAALLLESTPKGALAAAKLKALENGNTDALKLHFESDIDQALSFYSLQKEAWWYPVFNSGVLLVNPDDYERYIRSAANYRKNHPSPTKVDVFDVVPSDKTEFRKEYKDMAKGLREHMQRVDDAVKAYADE